ncbi:MAG: hypothetical protein BWK79_12895 [Beggiatoa sp. IS2]|nr:MAG: hypothetical protein BWK79_12895 [Beggiatoa sp. IS2]
MTHEIASTDESELVKECFAVIYTPKRQRNRFPENCVQIVTSEQEALKMANIAQKRYPAKVVGPSRSSEGLKLYYLVGWLD